MIRPQNNNQPNLYVQILESFDADMITNFLVNRFQISDENIEPLRDFIEELSNYFKYILVTSLYLNYNYSQFDPQITSHISLYELQSDLALLNDCFHSAFKNDKYTFHKLINLISERANLRNRMLMLDESMGKIISNTHELTEKQFSNLCDQYQIYGNMRQVFINALKAVHPYASIVLFYAEHIVFSKEQRLELFRFEIDHESLVEDLLALKNIINLFKEKAIYSQEKLAAKFEVINKGKGFFNNTDHNSDSVKERLALEFNSRLATVENYSDFESLLRTTFSTFVVEIYKNLDLALTLEEFSAFHDIHPYYLLLLLRISNTVEFEPKVAELIITKLGLFDIPYTTERLYSYCNAFNRYIQDLTTENFNHFIEQRKSVIKRNNPNPDVKKNILPPNGRQEPNEIGLFNSLKEVKTAQDFEKLLTTAFEQMTEKIHKAVEKQAKSQISIELFKEFASQLHPYYILLFIRSINAYKFSAKYLIERINTIGIFESLYDEDDLYNDGQMLIKIIRQLSTSDEVIKAASKLNQRLIETRHLKIEKPEAQQENSTEAFIKNVEFDDLSLNKAKICFLELSNLLQIPIYITYTIFDHLKNGVAISDELYLEINQAFKAKHVKLTRELASQVQHIFDELVKLLENKGSISQYITSSLIDAEHSYWHYINNNDSPTDPERMHRQRISNRNQTAIFEVVGKIQENERRLFRARHDPHPKES